MNTVLNQRLNNLFLYPQSNDSLSPHWVSFYLQSMVINMEMFLI